MNSSISDLDLQRLIDGELSERQQQSLLSQLEATEDWRRVALAFVEQQVWSRACHTVPAEPASVPVSAARRPDVRSRGISWPVLAATAVIAVGLGFLVGSRTNESATNSLADLPGAESKSSDDQFAEPQPVMNLQLVSGDPDAEEPLNIPVYDPSVTGYGFWDETPLMPEDVQEQFFRQGYDVRQAREFYRILLDDGSEIALPVDTVHVRYAGL